MRRNSEEFEALLHRWVTASIDDAEVGWELALEAEAYSKALARVVLARAASVKGSSYRTLGRHDEAIAMFARALRLLPEDEYVARADAHRRMAYVLLEQRNFDGALREADRAISLYEVFPGEQHERGKGYVAKGVTVHPQSLQCSRLIWRKHG